ncbi:MAG: polyprenyl synthetase family protein [Acidimicrobiia bacterium]|nr:polyprenyl synthetase family protein [Acidimicrobiia bacterium]
MAPTSPLQVLPTMIDDLARVEIALDRAVETDFAFLDRIARHLIAAGGKRVRPGFCVASAATGLDPAVAVSDDVITGAAAVELVHLGSLYHDDVMDDATVRRNVTSVNAEWGNHRAILAGDYLLARASELAASLGTEVAALLATTIARLCDGQIRELQDTRNVARTLEDYERSIAGKTASLLATACRIGGISGGVGRADIDAVTEFGHSYGIAFQIVDDILDVTATEAELGKPAGNDLLEGTFTLPVILAMESADGAQLRELLGTDLDSDAHGRALVLIRASGGVEAARDHARAWADKAAAALTSLPDTLGTHALQAAAGHLVERAALPS